MIDGGGASRTTEPAAGSSAATDVSLREYFNEKIAADRLLNKERFAFVAVVGGVIWFFVERHLGDLNHENARVAKVSENSVSQDTYSANESQRKSELDKLDTWRHDVDSDRQTIATIKEVTEGTKVDRRGSLDTTTKVIGTVVALILVLLALLNYQVLHKGQTTTTDTVTTTLTVTTPNP